MSNLYFSYLPRQAFLRTALNSQSLASNSPSFPSSYKYQKCTVDQRLSWPALILFPMPVFCSKKTTKNIPAVEN